MRVDKISISLPVFLSLLLVYLEAIFHIYEFRTLTGEIFFTVLFSAMGGILLGAFAGQPFDFLDVIGKNIMLTLMGIIVLIFLFQIYRQENRGAIWTKPYNCKLLETGSAETVKKRTGEVGT